MTSPPLFSVIIPTYNRANFIGETIASVRSQQFQDFEIIVVDDGSTDNTADVVAPLKGDRLRYIKIANSERGVARNTGGLSAKGQYVTFLDSDDLLRPDHLQMASDFIRKRPVEIFSLGYEVVRPDKSVVHRWKKLPSPVNDKLLEGNFLSCLGVFIRRDVFIANRFNEDRELAGSEDYELWLRLAAKYSIYTIPKSTAYLVQHDSRSVLNFSVGKLIRRMTLLDHYVSNNPGMEAKFGSGIMTFKAYNDLYTALHLALARDNSAALQYAIRAVRFHKPILFNYRLWVVMKKIIFRF